ncbi:4573_t:CDS:2, partial [Funneliformis geosporum]
MVQKRKEDYYIRENYKLKENMHKTLKKNKYATSLTINSNTDEINTGLDRETNFSEYNS